MGAEVKNPARNIPLSLFSGTLLVICLYLLLNITYVYALPGPEMSGVIDVGARAAESLLGERAARAVSGAIAICILSVIGAMILTGPRIYYAMARDVVFFNLFGKLSAKRNTLAYSVLLQAAVAVFMTATAAGRTPTGRGQAWNRRSVLYASWGRYLDPALDDSTGVRAEHG